MANKREREAAALALIEPPHWGASDWRARERAAALFRRAGPMTPLAAVSAPSVRPSARRPASPRPSNKGPPNEQTRPATNGTKQLAAPARRSKSN